MFSDGIGVLARSAAETTRWCGRSERNRRIVAALTDRPKTSFRVAGNANSILVCVPAHNPFEVIKISTTKAWPLVQGEYGALAELARVPKTKRWTVPQTLGCNEAANAYVMSYHSGIRLDRLATATTPGAAEETQRALWAAGSALGDIHRAWEFAASGKAESALGADLRWLINFRVLDPTVLAPILGCLSAARFTRSYWDFDPVNVIWTEDGVVLLDPPEIAVVGAAAWDIGVFLAGIRRAGWRTRYFGAGWALADVEEAFLEGYGATAYGLTSRDRLLAEVACLLRLAQLREWWVQPWRPRWTTRNVARAGWARSILTFAMRAQGEIVNRAVVREKP